MSFAPIALIMPQYENYANWWLKAYEQGTVTPLNMATDAGGGATLSKCELDSAGFPITAAGARFIPFIDGDYDLWLFPTKVEATKNITDNAIQVADNLNSAGTNADFLPSLDITYSLGSDTFSWQNLYLGGDIFDQNGNEILSLNETSLAVNQVEVQNAVTTNGPTITASGDDTNIDLNITPKGSGGVNVTTTSGDISLTSSGSLNIAANTAITGTFSTTGAITSPETQVDAVKFPATQVPSADANTLDDYEEGTFTPELWDASSSGAEGQTYLQQLGEYQKIGNRVFFDVALQVNSLGTLTPGDSAFIGGLPFTPASSQESACAVGECNSMNITAGQSVGGDVSTSTNRITLRLFDSTAGTTNLLISEFSSLGSIIISGSYKV